MTDRHASERATGAGGIGLAAFDRNAPRVGRASFTTFATTGGFPFRDADPATVGTAALRMAIIIGIIDALETIVARQAGETGAGLRLPTGSDLDGAGAPGAVCTRTTHRAVGADGASRVELGAVVVVDAFTLRVARADPRAVQCRAPGAVVLGIIDTQVALRAGHAGQSTAVRQDTAKDAEATAVRAAGRIAVVGAVIDAAIPVRAGRPLNSAAGQRSRHLRFIAAAIASLASGVARGAGSTAAARAAAGGGHESQGENDDGVTKSEHGGLLCP